MISRIVRRIMLLLVYSDLRRIEAELFAMDHFQYLLPRDRELSAEIAFAALNRVRSLIVSVERARAEARK